MVKDVTAYDCTNSDSTDRASDPVGFWVRVQILEADSLSRSIWSWQLHKGCGVGGLNSFLDPDVDPMPVPRQFKVTKRHF